MPTRDEAYQFMTTHVKNENLQKHMLAVEAAMRFYAPKFGEDQKIWGMTGLLHDCDYEKFPDLREHTLVSAGWLREDGYDERIIYAILAHNDLNIATHPRNNPLSHALYACDEITGMITATAPITKCHSKKLFRYPPRTYRLVQPATCSKRIRSTWLNGAAYLSDLRHQALLSHRFLNAR